MLHTILTKIRQKIINNVGCAAARWILHNCDDGLVVKRRGGAEQIIKVFSAPAYRNIIKPIIKKISEGLFRVGDVVTDDGYYGEIVITNIQDNWIKGYSLKDGMVFNNLDSRQFKRVVGYVDLKID